MPWADVERNRAAVRNWMQRNPERVKAAKERWKAKIRKAHALGWVTQKEFYRVELLGSDRYTPEQRKYFKKLRRNGVRLKRAQELAYG